MAIPMGLCIDDDGIGTGLLDPNAIFKRKFRWQLVLSYTCDQTLFTYTSFNAYSANRPKMSRSETELHYLGQKYRVPGSVVEYEPMELSVYDVAGVGDSNPLYYWLAAYMRLTNPGGGLTPPNTLFGDIVLNLLDGCGNTIERWLLDDVWPSNVDFGEIDMSSSDVCMINMTLRFNLATLNIPQSTDPDDDNCSKSLVMPTCCGASSDPAFVALNPTTSLDDLPEDFSDPLWENPISEPNPSSNPPSITTGSTLYTGNYSYLTVTIGNGLSTPCISFLAQNRSGLGAATSIVLNVFIQLENGNRITMQEKSTVDPAQSNLYTIAPNPISTLCQQLTSPIVSYDVNVIVDGQTDSYSS